MENSGSTHEGIIRQESRYFLGRSAVLSVRSPRRRARPKLTERQMPNSEIKCIAGQRTSRMMVRMLANTAVRLAIHNKTNRERNSRSLKVAELGRLNSLWAVYTRKEMYGR